MTLTLDPRFPVLWRTPNSLQVGVDSPRVVLTDVSTGHERMLAGLALGLTPEGLALIGKECGLSAQQVADFEDAIRPALLESPQDTCASVQIDGIGPTADRLEYRLREVGLKPQRWFPRGDHLPRRSPSPAAKVAKHAEIPSDGGFAVILGDYVLDPERRGRWLRRDIPHLPIVFSDTSVTVGPFIEPGSGPCLYCLELHRTDAEPAWPALASQLLGTASTAHSALLASEAATIATRLVLNRSRGMPARSATSLTVNAETGERYNRSWRVHPRCGCAGITAEGEQYRQETAKANSVPPADCAMPTTKDEVVSVPA